MSYLNLGDCPLENFTDAIISVWFTVPQSAISAAQADWSSRIALDDPLPYLEAGIVPLLSWGPQPPTSFTQVSGAGGGTETFSGHQASSCIGVYCGYSLKGSGGDLTNNLYTRLQLENGLSSLAPNNDIPPEMVGAVQYDFFQVGGLPMGSVAANPDPGGEFKDLLVDPDVWHHGLISFSISGGSASFWQALDDVDYSGPYLAPYNGGQDGNGIKTAHTSANAPDVLPAGGGPVPCSGSPMGLPAANNRVAYIQPRCQMAELQVFTGVTLDTSDDTQRRYFVDEDGKPVPPDQKANPDTGQTSGSIEGLGQRPDILLHRASNWKKGKNTGTTGMDYSAKPPRLLFGGQFSPSGSIQTVKPDPVLGGTSSIGGNGGPVQLRRNRLLVPRRR